MAVMIKKLKEQRSVYKKRVNFEGYKKFIQNNEVILRAQKSFKSKVHNVFTEKINKIVLSFSDDKRLQLFDKTKL